MAGKELPTPEEMQEMAGIDIRTVDTSSLVDIEQVQIQTGLSLIHIWKYQEPDFQ